MTLICEQSKGRLPDGKDATPKSGHIAVGLNRIVQTDFDRTSVVALERWHKAQCAAQAEQNHANRNVQQTRLDERQQIGRSDNQQTGDG